nr:MAG TPA: hypothetical protein [Caudoviricetes sp.]
MLSHKISLETTLNIFSDKFIIPGIYESKNEQR